MKQVTIVVPECRVNMNTIGGAFDILNQANEYWMGTGNDAAIELCIAGFVPEQRSHSEYLSIHPIPISTIQKTDLILIPAPLSDHENAVKNNQSLIEWIRTQYANGAEIASMCAGGFLLAATGLLNGKRCSIHWNAIKDFKQLFPEVEVAGEKIITAEKGIYTNGGAYSFLNLILYLVEKLFDRATAIYCSKFYQIDIERHSQSPFTIFDLQKGHDDALIGEAQTYIEEHIDAKISFEQLAKTLAISRRNFDRRFIRATGDTPVAYLQRVKIEAAKKELEKGQKTVFEVMLDVGYTDDKAFREVFKKITGLSPTAYRSKYTTVALN